MNKINTFFEKNSKKRDLSDQSNNGDESKRPREVSPNMALYSPSTVDEVFDANAESNENSIEIIMKCIKSIERKVESLTKTTEDSQIKGDKHLKDLSDAVQFISQKFDEYEKDRNENLREIKELKEELIRASMKNDKLEQYSRRNCLLIHGIKENEEDNTDVLAIDTINDKLDLHLSVKDLDRSHRIGRPKLGNKSKPRPIIVKFLRYNDRRQVFVNKKSFKDSGITITESLTSDRLDMLRRAREEYGFRKAWSIDGKIMFYNENEKKVQVYFD